MSSVVTSESSARDRRRGRYLLAAVVLVALVGVSEGATAQGLQLQLPFTSVVGGNKFQATLALREAAKEEMIFVLTVSPAGVLELPSSKVNFQPGQAQIAVDMATTGVASSTKVDIAVHKADSTGAIVSTASLTVLPASLVALTLSRSEVVGGTPGSTVTATVKLDGMAAPGGTTVVLGKTCTNCTPGVGAAFVKSSGIAYSDPVTVPASVVVPQRSRVASFTMETGIVASSSNVVLIAGLGGVSQQASLVVEALRPVSMSVSPATITSSQSATLTVVLNAPAYSGAGVSFSCSVPVDINNGVCDPLVRPPFGVVAGQQNQTFLVTGHTSSPTQTTIKVAHVNLQTTLTLLP